jgi:hypothetical protein
MGYRKPYQSKSLHIRVCVCVCVYTHTILLKIQRNKEYRIVVYPRPIYSTSFFIHSKVEHLEKRNHFISRLNTVFNFFSIISNCTYCTLSTANSTANMCNINNQHYALNYITVLVPIFSWEAQQTEPQHSGTQAT